MISNCKIQTQRGFRRKDKPKDKSNDRNQHRKNKTQNERNKERKWRLGVKNRRFPDRESKPSAQRQRTARAARTTRQINGANFLVGGAKVGGLHYSPWSSRKPVTSRWRVNGRKMLILTSKTNGFLENMDSLCSSHCMKIRVL